MKDKKQHIGVTDDATPQTKTSPFRETWDPLLSRKEAAAYLGLAERTLAIWAVTGRYGLEMIKIGRLAKYRKSALDNFINERVKNEYK